jgi:hypothetical protein
MANLRYNYSSGGNSYWYYKILTKGGGGLRWGWNGTGGGVVVSSIINIAWCGHNVSYYCPEWNKRSFRNDLLIGIW